MNRKLCQQATREGDKLSVEVPITATNNTYTCTATVDLTPFESYPPRLRVAEPLHGVVVH